jgi:hypothetical protein
MALTFAVTMAMLVLAVVIVTVVDVWLYRRGGTRETISWLVWSWSLNNPILPFMVGFLLGVLCGHLFAQMQPGG